MPLKVRFEVPTYGSLSRQAMVTTTTRRTRASESLVITGLFFLFLFGSFLGRLLLFLLVLALSAGGLAYRLFKNLQNLLISDLLIGLVF